jgi:ribosomal protein S18 acetylase RimI-like enzyme
MELHLKAGRVFAEAFQNYPLMKYAFEGCTEERKQKGLLDLYTHCTKAAMQYGGLHFTDDGLGAIIWLPGKNFQLGLVKEIKSGMAAIPFKLGLKPTFRLMNHDAESEGYVRKHAGPNMGYIWVVGVTRAAQGKGHSRKLIDKSVNEMKQQGLTEFWLKTEDPKNVLIYERLGFTLMHEMIVKSSGLRSWIMKREER